MNKVIGFCGSSNTGKSTALNNLIKLLDSKKKDFLRIEIDPSLDNKLMDRRATFKHLESGWIISIATGGDVEWTLEENCDYFTKHKANIAISATKSKGSTCDVLTAYSLKKTKHPVFWVYSSGVDKHNIKVSKELNDERISQSIEILSNMYAKNLFDLILLEIKQRN